MSWFTDRLKDVVHAAGLVESQTAAQTLDAGTDNNKIIVLGDAAPGNITLPAVTNTGFRVRVITGFAITSAVALVSAEGDNMEGSLIVNGAAVTVDAADQINFVETAENIGDWVEVISDGTYWHVTGVGLTAGSLTATG